MLEFSRNSMLPLITISQLSTAWHLNQIGFGQSNTSSMSPMSAFQVTKHIQCSVRSELTYFNVFKLEISWVFWDP